MTDQPSKDLVVASNAYSRAGLTERQQYIRMLAAAGNLLPAHLRAGTSGDPGKAFLLAETGDMLGIHPMAAVTGVHIIEGKPSLSANLMTGLVRKAGHVLRVTVTGKPEDESLAATAQLIRSDDPDFTFEVTWTVADAKRAGLWGKGNWLKYPRAMMKSRVVSEIIREGASDVLMGGNVYTPEELGVTVDEQGDPINLKQVRDDDAPSQGETPPAPAAPVVDEQRVQTEADVVADPNTGEVKDIDWAKAIEDVKTADEALALYRTAGQQGVLDMEIRRGRAPKRILGPWLIEIGKALRQAEEEADAAAAEAMVFAEAEAEHAAATEADDPNVVDAEVVEDGK